MPEHLLHGLTSISKFLIDSINEKFPDRERCSPLSELLLNVSGYAFLQEDRALYS